MLKKLLITLILSFFLTVIPMWLIWAHHMFVTGLNPFLGVIFMVVSIVTTVLLFVFIIRKISGYLKGKIFFTPAVLFAIGFFSFLIADLMTQIFYGNSTLDIHLHDTYYVIAHTHVMLFLAIIFGIFSATYYFYPVIFKRYMNAILGYIHFWVTFFCAYLVFYPLHYEGLAGMPRRYIDYSGWNSYNQFSSLNEFVSKTTIALCVAQILFLFNFFYSTIYGKKKIYEG
ncbi:MAG: cbb3-type cytochrome c oxidase subunit I [Bacteroidetes bacterium]|nr:cbb3-type cytochrome c oxidase subunit I [Bacteroidota bacterium]